MGRVDLARRTRVRPPDAPDRWHVQPLAIAEALVARGLDDAPACVHAAPLTRSTITRRSAP